MTRRLAAVLIAIAAETAAATAQTYSCRAYPPPAVLSQIKTQVEIVRRTEQEAADRLAGLDTRPYGWLRDQARTADAAIAVPTLLTAEDALKRCEKFITPVRGTCAIASSALVRLLEQLAAGNASDEAKFGYAQTMPKCEHIFGLKPLDTALRRFKWPP